MLNDAHAASDITPLKQLMAEQDQLSLKSAQTRESLRATTKDTGEIRSMTTCHPLVSPTHIRFGSRPAIAPGFVKRQEQDELFKAIFTHAEPRTVLTGMRRSGEMQLAAVVAVGYEEDGWPLVALIHAAPRKETLTGLYKLALRIGIDAPKNIPLEAIVRGLLDRLRLAKAADRLSVFDNVENPDDLRDLIPEGAGVRTLITTPHYLGRDRLGWLRVTVGSLDREQSIPLLCKHTGDTYREVADRIADVLNNVSVATTQAAMTAQQGGYALSGYLDRLSHHPFESCMSRLEGASYSDAVGITLLMAYEQVLKQLRIEHPQQERITVSPLGILPLLAASGVPTHWFLRLDGDSDAVRDTLSPLKSAVILQESSNGTKTIIHWPQGHVYRETYLNDQRKLGEARTCATSVLSGTDVDRLDNGEQRRNETHHLIEQFLSVISQDYSQPLFSEPRVPSKLAETLHDVTSLGMLQLALGLIDSVTQACDALDPHHLDTLAPRNNLAGTYRASGRLDKAVAPCGQVLSGRSRVLGTDHSSTLTSHLSLAGTYQTAGRLSEAIPLYEQVLSGRSRVLGPDHRSILMSRDELAGAYREANRFDEAITLKKQILVDALHIMGSDSPGASAIRLNLVAIYRDVGRLDEVITLYKENFDEISRALGLDHPETLASRHSLAGAYRDTGRLDEAIPLSEQNLTDLTRLTGPDHPETLTSRGTLVGTYRDADRLDETIRLFEQNLVEVGRALGLDHPETLASCHSLAGTHRDTDRSDEAIPLFKQNLTDFIRIPGPDCPDTFTSRSTLTSVHQAVGKIDDTIPLFERNFEDRTRTLGSHDPRTLTSRNHLAGTYREAGRLDEAVRLFEQNLADFTRLAGPDHFDIFTSRGNLANAYQTVGRLDQAIPSFGWNLTDSTHVLGPVRSETLAWRDSLAGAYQAAGRLNEAIALFERNLTGFIRVLGPARMEILASRGNLAGAYQTAGRLDRAIPLFQQNLEDHTHIPGPDRRDALTSCNNLAGAYQVAGRLDQAISLLQQNLDDSVRTLGPHRPPDSHLTQ